jgi:hypothetical protein
LISEHSLNDIANWLDGFRDLNPTTVEEEDSSKSKQYKNDLFGSVIPALDRRDLKYYGKLNDEQKKDISIWVLTRWMSSTGVNALEQVSNVNTVVNTSSKFLNKHKELQWMLLAMTGAGRPVKHQWVAAPKGTQKNKIEEAVLNRFPLLRDQELELFLKINSEEDLVNFFKDNGYDDKTIKEIFKGAKGK